MRPLILGDVAYPLCIYQLNPYLETANLSESKKKKKKINRNDWFGCAVVNRAFGIFKSRLHWYIENILTLIIKI